MQNLNVKLENVSSISKKNEGGKYLTRQLSQR